jgi:hypothetical protein
MANQFLMRLLLSVLNISDLVSFSGHSVLSGQEGAPQKSLLLPDESIDAQGYNERCSRISFQKDHDTLLSDTLSEKSMDLLVSLRICHRVGVFHQSSRYGKVLVQPRENSAGVYSRAQNP